MTTPVKERIKTELEQAKEEGKQRAVRISDILKAAASMTVEEIKGGSAELQVLTRKSVAELLEELKETPDLENAPVAETAVNAETHEINDSVHTPPTWKELISHALEIVRDRKGDWFQQLKDYLNENAARFDGDMTDEHGDRYLKVKTFFKRAVAWLEAARAKAQKSAPNHAAQPVNIEVVDGDTPEPTVHRNVNLIEAELRDEPAQ